MSASSSAEPSKKILNVGPTNLETYVLPQEGYSVQITHTLKSIQKTWDALVPSHNIFLQRAYLETLENYPPATMTFNYLVFYQGQCPIGIGYTQNFKIKGGDSLSTKLNEEAEKPACRLRGIRSALENWLIKKATFNILIAGNLLLTGEHGHYFKGLNEEQGIELMRQGTAVLHKKIEKQGTKVQLILFKDFLPSSTATTRNLEQHAFHKFKVQPSMYLPLAPEWKTQEDYLSAMSSKYRVKARRAAKKGKNILKKEFDLASIQENEEQLFGLYKSVADNADFNAFTLHKGYFGALKEYLRERYKLIAYYIDNQLIAFYTTIFSGEDMQAHFLGLDKKYNRSHQVYLNILYDLVRMGIYHRVKRVDFARTALEIKSSVGALPRDMNCFIKHRNRFSGTIIRLLLKYLNSEEKWQQRRPFKGKFPPAKSP